MTVDELRDQLADLPGGYLVDLVFKDKTGRHFHPAQVITVQHLYGLVDIMGGPIVPKP